MTNIYEALQKLLGQANSLQIGSYPRFTAITPLHDLDVLYVIGRWEAPTPDASGVLAALSRRVGAEFENPTRYTLRTSTQTHSITISFMEGKEEVFSVDVVPAYTFSSNEFGQATYMVPEVLKRGHRQRKDFYEDLAKRAVGMNWVKSDPRGYIEVAKTVNEKNGDFRKSVKLVKAWQRDCKERDDRFELKSFHIEQVITGYFLDNSQLEVFDAVFKFFCDVPRLIERSQIPDRADANAKIDGYIDSLTPEKKELVIQARDAFLIALEDFSTDSGVADLVDSGFHKRVNSEMFLFDFGIPMLIEGDLKIRATVLARSGGFRERVLDALGLIEVDRKIEFRLSGSAPTADLYKWKVRNDDRSPQPRGDITDHRTRNDPEHSKIQGRTLC